MLVHSKFDILRPKSTHLINLLTIIYRRSNINRRVRKWWLRKTYIRYIYYGLVKPHYTLYLSDELIAWSSHSENLHSPTALRNSPHFMKPERSLPHSQVRQYIQSQGTYRNSLSWTWSTLSMPRSPYRSLSSRQDCKIFAFLISFIYATFPVIPFHLYFLKRVI
jgi:hypothetical protein